jgi:hypothetical protein
MSPTSFSANQNPQRSPEATPAVLIRLRPRWLTFLSILLLLVEKAHFKDVLQMLKYFSMLM